MARAGEENYVPWKKQEFHLLRQTIVFHSFFIFYDVGDKNTSWRICQTITITVSSDFKATYPFFALII